MHRVQTTHDRRGGSFLESAGRVRSTPCRVRRGRSARPQTGTLRRPSSQALLLAGSYRQSAGPAGATPFRSDMPIEPRLDRSNRAASYAHGPAHHPAPRPTDRSRRLAFGTMLQRNSRRCSARLPNHGQSQSRRFQSGRVPPRHGRDPPPSARGSERFHRAYVVARSPARRRSTPACRGSQPRSCSTVSSASAALCRWLTAFFSFSVSTAKLRPSDG